MLASSLSGGHSSLSRSACRPPLTNPTPPPSIIHYATTTTLSSFIHRLSFCLRTAIMTTIVSNSSSPHDDDNIPTATLALPYVINTTSTSRRLPPPCWSSDETLVLIEAYKEKWYSLRRGNLRANHWQEVADEVASRFQAIPPKTAVQCRHKMEKLRKRYRAEIQRATAHGGVRRFSSSWVLFQSMHAMEKGPNYLPSPPSSDEEEEGVTRNDVKRINDLYGGNQNGVFGNQGSASNGVPAGVRIKIPGMVTTAPAKVYNRFNEIGDQNHINPNPRFSNFATGVYGTPSNRVMREGLYGRSESGKRAIEIPTKDKGDAGVSEVVEAIQALGEGFMRIEKVKMDMARQVEEMRMKMELKRTEMILESQQRIVDAFAKTVSETSAKKVKRTSPPECSNGAGAGAGAAS